MEKARHHTVCSSLLIVSFAVALVGLAYPIYVIRPFRYQGPRELAVALELIQVRTPVEILCVVCALAALVFYRRIERRRARRNLALAGTLLVCAFAVLTRVNVYELMFHPDSRPLFAAAAQSRVDPDDMVLAVKLGGSARAYPIRSIAYHHIINDTVGGVPIAATY